MIIAGATRNRTRLTACCAVSLGPPATSGGGGLFLRNIYLPPQSKSPIF